MANGCAYPVSRTAEIFPLAVNLTNQPLQMLPCCFRGTGFLIWWHSALSAFDHRIDALGLCRAVAHLFEVRR